MPVTIRWSWEVQPGEVARLGGAGVVNAEAFDCLQLDIAGGTVATPATKEVEVQPGGTDRVLFLLVASTLYDPHLSYAVDGGADIVLDAPQLFLGPGAVALLGATQNKFKFKNEAGADRAAAVTIVVGRKASA
jgi:hypothetical protein